MTMQRIQAVVAAGGLVLLAAAALAFALEADRWAGALLALGLLAVAAVLLRTARLALREIRTVKANLGRTARDLGRGITAHRDAQGQASEHLQRRVQAVAARLDEVAESARLRSVQQDLTALSTEVERLRDAPGPAVWHSLADLRREGVACLVMASRDADAILAVEDTDTRFEVCDPSGTPGTRGPATPAHAVGAVVVDLDLFARSSGADDGGAGPEAGPWETFLRWLRVEVPVVGFSRFPGQLAHRAASLGRASGGVLLPAAATSTVVHFARRADVPRGCPVHVPSGTGGAGAR
jgi:hypothetical protein